MTNQINEELSGYVKFAKILARNLIKKGKFDQAPIVLNSVFKFIGQEIKVSAVDLGNEDGFSVGSTIIKYNSVKPVVRQRFTVAHELGHILMGHNTTSRVTSFDTKDPNEHCANVFASELLVPTVLIKKECLNLESLSSLATKYNVSKDMMMWRLKGLRLDEKIKSWE